MTPTQIKQQIDALQFAQTELLLYLDVHPDDDMARRQWQRNMMELAQHREQYTERTGKVYPMTQSENGGSPAWINEPWPWDNQK